MADRFWEENNMTNADIGGQIYSDGRLSEGVVDSMGEEAEYNEGGRWDDTPQELFRVRGKC